MRSASAAAHHHCVYVVLLDEGARSWSRTKKADKSKTCVYVGMTGLTPEDRFENHKNGVKAAGVVKKFGERLLPELYEHLNPMPYEAALAMEADLAEDLRAEGYCVFGGH